MPCSIRRMPGTIWPKPCQSTSVLFHINIARYHIADVLYASWEIHDTRWPWSCTPHEKYTIPDDHGPVRLMRNTRYQMTMVLCAIWVKLGNKWPSRLTGLWCLNGFSIHGEKILSTLLLNLSSKQFAHQIVWSIISTMGPCLLKSLRKIQVQSVFLLGCDSSTARLNTDFSVWYFQRGIWNTSDTLRQRLRWILQQS